MNTEFLEDLKKIDNWKEVCAQFGKMINLGKPAPTAVVNRAFADNKFAHYLLMTKDSPQLQKQLLEDPRNAEYEEKKNEKNFSNGALLAKASGAMVRWAKAGFTQVDNETLNKRLSACLACPYLQTPPKKAIYTIVKLAGGNQAICGLCGCSVSRKAKLPTETCPGQDPKNAHLNFWGEPLKK